MLQDGLAYDDLLTSAKERQSQSAEAKASKLASAENEPILRKYTFLMNKKRRIREPRDGVDEMSRKKPRLETAETQQPVPDGPETSRPRQKGRKKSTVARPSIEDEPVTEPEPAEPEKIASPVEEDVEMIEEIPSLPTTLELGHSIGVQSETTPAEATATTVVDLIQPGASIMHLSWGRSDPSQLMATGASIWRSWFVPPAISKTDEPIQPKTIDHASTPDCFVSAVATARANEDIALAVENVPQQGELMIQTYDAENGTQFIQLNPNTEVVLRLSFSENSNKLLVLSAHSQHCEATVHDVARNRPIGNLQLRDPSYDAEWISDFEFVVTGDKYIASATVESKVQQQKMLNHERSFVVLKWDKHTRRVACVDISGEVHLLDTKLFELETSGSQEGGINSAEWQPIRAVYNTATPRILATGSPNGTINIWDARQNLQLLHKVVMGNFAPVLAIAFSPDGRMIAGAGDDRICIWKATEESKAVIQYQVPGSGVVQDSSPPEDEESYEFAALSWNANGSQLAYSYASKLRVVSV
jgi:WD40 repeat protein